MLFPRGFALIALSFLFKHYKITEVCIIVVLFRNYVIKMVQLPRNEFMRLIQVQCDHCGMWYHMECVADRGVNDSNADDFDCGCREAAKNSDSD